MNELKKGVILGILSQIQVDIFEAKIQGGTYKSLTTIYKLSGNNAIQHCLKRTANGRLWYPGHGGGGEPYLSDVDQYKFKTIITDAVDLANCITTSVAS